MNEQLALNLERFTLTMTAGARPRGKRAPWKPPTGDDFAEGAVLAFDQTLTHTGWAIMQSFGGLGLVLLGTGMIQPSTDLTSHEGTYAKASHLALGIRTTVLAFRPSEHRHVVYERPSMEGRRTESALMAGMEVHRATLGSAVAVSNRHAKAVLIGRAGTRADPVTKAHVKEAVEGYIGAPGWHSMAWPWNEHVRDAVMLGLTHLYDLKQIQGAVESP